MKLNLTMFVSVVTIMLFSSIGYASPLSGSITTNTQLATTAGIYQGSIPTSAWCSPNDRTIVAPLSVTTTGTYSFTNLSVNNGAGGENLFLQINTTPGPNYQPLINIDTYGNSPVQASPSGTLTAGTQYYFVAVTACVNTNNLPVAFTVELSGVGSISIDSTEVEGDSVGGSVDMEAVASTIIISDVARTTRGAINVNNKMVSQGLARFMGDRESKTPLAVSVSSRGLSAFTIQPNVTPINNGDGLSINGTFGGVESDSAYRRVTFGEFDLQHEPGSGTTLNFNTRLAWERAAGDDAMLAYFLGAEVNNSMISSTYTGTQRRYGVTAGMYGIKALGQNLYAAGYGSFGMARNNLNITDGTDDISGSYNTRSFGLGAQLSGSIDRASYKIRPTLGLNFMQTLVGDVSLSSTSGGTSVTSTAAIGNTSTLQLLATPEFLFPVEVNNLDDVTVIASFAPRLICDSNYGAGVVTRNCGPGTQFGLNQESADGMTTINTSISLDRVGGVDRLGLNLQAEIRF